MIYRIFLMNFGYYTQDSCKSLDEAIAAAKRTGFECIICEGDKPVKVWSPIGGLRNYGA